MFFFFGKSESRSIYWSISIVPSGFCCGYHQCFFGKSISIRLLQSPLVESMGFRKKKRMSHRCESEAHKAQKGISWYIYIDRFIDEAAPEWTNGISHMCPELLSNGLFHSARKKNPVQQRCDVFHCGFSQHPRPLRWTLQTSSGLLPSWR